MEDKETIDLRALFDIALHYKKNIIAIIAVCTGLAMIAAFFILPKSYESTVLVRAKSQNQGGLSAAAGAMAVLGLGGNVAAPTTVYIDLMKSRAVIEPIIAKIAVENEAQREKITAKKFVSERIEIKNNKGTDLIELTANAAIPEEAQMIAGDVINNFLLLMTQLNQNQQSLMVKFLADRIELAKKEMSDAENKLEEFRQQKKIYIPDEQAKAMIEKMSVFDKAVSELKANADSDQARLKNIVKQLDKQNFALQEFKITDNESIQKIKDNIIAKQIGLIEQEQRYTDKHPNVIVLKEEIAGLNQKLSQEINQSVSAGTNTLNPVHAGLLKAKVETETALAMYAARQTALEEICAKAEQEISHLSENSVAYVKLQRDVSVAQEIYTVLVKNYENARIQEAMDSMDVQIVDAADLPKQPAGPKKKLITIIGGFIGLLVAFGYVAILYSRKNKNGAYL